MTDTKDQFFPRMSKDIQDNGGHHGIDKFVCLLNADGTTLLFVSGADVSRAKYHEQQLNDHL